MKNHNKALPQKMTKYQRSENLELAQSKTQRTSIQQIKLIYTDITSFFLLISSTLILLHVFLYTISTYIFNHPSTAILYRLFQLNKEKNFPTLFSSILILSCSLLMFIIFVLNKDNKKARWTWFILALIFMLLSFDEAASLHERLEMPIKQIFNDSEILSVTWVIPLLLLIGYFISHYTLYLLELPKRHRNLMLIACFLYISGAFLMDMIGGWYADQHGETSLSYFLIATFEEVLEIAGMMTFQHALLFYIKSTWSNISIHISKEESSNTITSEETVFSESSLLRK